MLRKLLGYAAYMFGANLFTAALSFGATAFGMITRPKEAVGDYAIYMLIYEIGMGLCIYGANSAIQKYAAESDERRLIFGSLAYRLFLTLCGAGAGLGLLVGTLLNWNYALAFFGLPFLVAYWWARYLVRSRLDARREAGLMMVASLSNSVLQFLLLSFTDWRDALIYGDFVSLLIQGVAGLFAINNACGRSSLALLRVPVPRPLFWEALRFASPLWIAGQVFQAKAHLQGIWTTATLGSVGMGTLGGARMMWQFAMKPLEYLSNASLPGLLQVKGEERATLYRDLMRLCMVGFTAIGLVVAGGLPLVFQSIDRARVLLGRLDGELMLVKYAEIPALMLVLAFGMPIAAVEIVVNQYAVAEGRQKVVLSGHVANVVAAALCLVPLAERFGVAGVFLAGILGDIATGGTFLLQLRRDYAREVRTAVSWCLLTTLCLAAGMVPLYLYRAHPLSWLATGPGLLIFLSLTLLVRLVRLEDLRRARAALWSKKG